MGTNIYELEQRLKRLNIWDDDPIMKKLLKDQE